MIQLILKTIWYQRKKNVWILIEMVLVGFFLWKAVGVIFQTEYTMSIPNGYNEEGVYKMEIGTYSQEHDMYDATADNDSMRAENFRRLTNTLRQCPEVSSFFVMQAWMAVPCGYSYQASSVKIDTIDTNVQLYNEFIYDGADIFKTYEIHDAYTGKILQVNKTIPLNKSVYISKNLADQYFKGKNPIGKKSPFSDDSLTVVAGVFSDMQTRCDEVPEFLAIIPSKMKPENFNGTEICFKIKPDVNEKMFEEHFRRDIAPRLSIGNYYMRRLTSLKDIRKNYESMSIDNALYFNILMSAFFLLCTFIGMVGTFWIRSNNRRGDIGIMKSMGASEHKIVRQFVMESWMLTSLAFLVAVLWRLNVAVFNDFFRMDSLHSDSAYLTYHPISLFLIYSVLTYLIMLIIALVGTYIPVRRAAKTLPAEALRDL